MVRDFAKTLQKRSLYCGWKSMISIGRPALWNDSYIYSYIHLYTAIYSYIQPYTTIYSHIQPYTAIFFNPQILLAHPHMDVHWQTISRSVGRVCACACAVVLAVFTYGSKRFACFFWMCAHPTEGAGGVTRWFLLLFLIKCSIGFSQKRACPFGLFLKIDARGFVYGSENRQNQKPARATLVISIQKHKFNGNRKNAHRI